MNRKVKTKRMIPITLIVVLFLLTFTACAALSAINIAGESFVTTMMKKQNSGSDTPYTHGSIKPDNVTQEQMDKTVLRLYNEWKSKYLKKNPYDPSQYYVWYSDGDFIENDAITVSEAHGYGMLLTVLMANEDKDAQALFDGLYQYFIAHPSSNNSDLMAWQQADNGQELVDVGGNESATDGDLDIAYALVLADKQWGSSGEINYLSQAKTVIQAIMESDVNQKEWILMLGDWSSEEDMSTRSSDFMLQHLKVFAAVTGDERWIQVVDKTYDIMRGIFKSYSSKTGLLPDFLIRQNETYQPAYPNFLESDFDGDYYYNACRFPWRVAVDYLMTGDKRALPQLKKFNFWVKAKTKGDPSNYNTGYTLAGKCVEEDTDLSFTAPLMVCAMIGADNQEWLNELWKYNTGMQTSEQYYYGNTLRLLCVITVAGNWK